LDPVAIALIAESAVALLSPYLKKTGSEIGAAANLATKKVGELLSVIKNRFEKNPTARESLNALYRSPNDTATKASFQAHLKELLSADEEFAKQLQKIIIEAVDSGADAVFHTNIYGNVKQLIQFGHVNRDVIIK